MKSVIFPSHVTVPPLTAAEQRWVCALNRVLQACPSSRLAAATAGHRSLTIYDADVERENHFHEDDGDFIPFLMKKGFALADVFSTFLIDSTAS